MNENQRIQKIEVTTQDGISAILQALKDVEAGIVESVEIDGLGALLPAELLTLPDTVVIDLCPKNSDNDEAVTACSTYMLNELIRGKVTLRRSDLTER